MFKLSFQSIGHVVVRNYMSFRNLFKISIVPNLIDPLFYLLAMGFGVGAYLTHVNGMLYRDFVITGLIAATAMSAATAETTVNAFIQYKIEKTYDAMLMTPINT
ncbi:TPA: ABC transporter permease, partial [Streptococcus pneumoniae]